MSASTAGTVIAWISDFMDKAEEIEKALKILGGNWEGIAFQNISNIYNAVLDALPCTKDYLQLEVISQTGLSDRKVVDRLKLLFHKKILTKKDNQINWNL